MTGASSGLGKALVAEALRRGHRVAAAARNIADLAEQVAQAPDRVKAIACDVADPAAIDAAVIKAETSFGRIDVLLNNAGYGFLTTVEEAGDDQIERQFAVNLSGPVRLMRKVLPGMRARGSGLIANVSSTAGSRGIAGSGYYCASKAALEAMTEALAGEVAPLGIRAMIVAPGPFRTDFMGRSLERPETAIDAYAPIAEQRQRYVETGGEQRGDPVRAARIIVDAILSDDPPLRLPLGAFACQTITTAYRDKIADIARSAELAPLADYPEDDR